MTLSVQIEELGERFHIETAHVRHVAQLALDIFDGFAPFPQGKPGDRDLLHAAALLHDIGYFLETGNHAAAGVKILQEHPVDFFSSNDWVCICAIIALHHRDWRPVQGQELFRNLGTKQQERVKTLAAILRIADGLDHGHIQDVSVVACARGKRVDKVSVHCRWYLGNIVWAEDKADLWEAFFKRSFRFEARHEKKKALFKGVVCKGDTVAEAGRKILYSQFSVMRDNYPGMRAGSNPEYLHDFRVAMRRFRTGLKFFAPMLHHPFLHELADRLSDLSDQLGEIRDIHVQCSFFANMEHLKQDADRRLRALVESPECMEIMQQSGRFLRTEFAAASVAADKHLFMDFAAVEIPAMRDAILKQSLKHVWDNMEKMHALRKVCRRARYCAEFAAPVLGKQTRHSAQYLKNMATALGEIRDIEAALDSGTPPELLIIPEQKLRNTMEGHWDRFEKNWKKLGDTSGLTKS